LSNPFKKLLNKRILVQMEIERHTGKILLPHQEERRRNWGKVLMVADDCTLRIEVGDYVAFSFNAGKRVPDSVAKDQIIVAEDEILARFLPGKDEKVSI
jgi:co-chaperonin GroES (HSP10)